MAKVHLADGRAWYFCPACEVAHRVLLGEEFPAEHRWTASGLPDVPTFSPSVAVRWRLWDEATQEFSINEVCHHFIEGGRIRYLGDSTHGLAGETVDLPEFPDSLRGFP